jgi:hypothetical protein
MQEARRAAWIEQGTSIHFKAMSPHGDPVELTADAARSIGERLVALADDLRALDRAP